MSVEDFLKSNPDLNRSGEEFGAAAEVNLDVSVSGISKTLIEFVHMGVHYKAEIKDVLRLEEAKNSSLGAKAATISLKRDAILLVQQAISASDLANAIPFGFQKLSSSTEQFDVPTARELAWARSTGYGMQRGIETESASGTFATGTKCPSKIDDERADEFA